MTQNQIAYQNYLENQRANKAREDETHRANLELEKWYQVRALNNPYSLAAFFGTQPQSDGSATANSDVLKINSLQSLIDYMSSNPDSKLSTLVNKVVQAPVKGGIVDKVITESTEKLDKGNAPNGVYDITGKDKGSFWDQLVEGWKNFWSWSDSKEDK